MRSRSCDRQGLDDLRLKEDRICKKKPFRFPPKLTDALIHTMRGSLHVGVSVDSATIRCRPSPSEDYS